MTDFATLAGCAVAQKLGIPLLLGPIGSVSISNPKGPKDQIIRYLGLG